MPEVTQQAWPHSRVWRTLNCATLPALLGCRKPVVLGTPTQGSTRTPSVKSSGSKQPRKSTRQSTHVEEIGLVPLAEEPLCRHVLQLLPRDTAA